MKETCSAGDSARDHRESTTYWFAILEIARERNDFDSVDEAQRQLDRLGVRVTYQRRPPTRQGGRS